MLEIIPGRGHNHGMRRGDLPLILFFLLLLLAPQARAKDHLTLHFIPAPVRTDWSTPRTLASSAVRNLIHRFHGGSRHGIGHLYVELECGGQFLVTGSTSIGNLDRENVLRHDYGLGVLFEKQPGMLEETEHVLKDLQSLHRTGRSNFLEFLISPDTCARLTRYLKEYRERGYDRIYGDINSRPLRGENAGCTAFGMSFLELAGLQHSEFERQWTQHLIVPRKFIGGPETGRRVPLLRILTDLHARWDRDLSEGGLPIDFWDPEKMVGWTRIAFDDLRRGARVFPWPAILAKRGRSRGIRFDARRVPTPQGPIFSLTPL